MNADGDVRDGAAVLDGVRLERERLAPLRARATRVVDTTATSVHELRRTVVSLFGPASGGAPRMITRIVSFGFKYGSPLDADLVLDVRFLDNPYFVPELKPLSGLDAPVAAYVLGTPEAAELMKKTRELLAFVLPKYEREGKSYLTIALGCTGGRHRSVAIAEALARELSGVLGSPIAVVHRDVGRQQATAAPLDRPPSEDGDRASALELKGAFGSTPPPGAMKRGTP